MATSKNTYAIVAAVYPAFGKVMAATALEVTGPDTKAILDQALGAKSRGDRNPNGAGTGEIVTGLSEKALVLALENCALVDAGYAPQGRKDPDAEETSAQS